MWLTLISWWFLILPYLVLLFLEPGKSSFVPLTICSCLWVEWKKVTLLTCSERRWKESSWQKPPYWLKMYRTHENLGHQQIHDWWFANRDFSGINDEICITLIYVFVPENHLKNLKASSARFCKNKVILYDFTVIIEVWLTYGNNLSFFSSGQWFLS